MDVQSCFGITEVRRGSADHFLMFSKINSDRNVGKTET
jgi:hypothetical protein